MTGAGRLLGEYSDEPALVRAIAELRERTVARLEVYSPYPLAAAEAALGGRRSRLPLLVFAAGLGGAALAYGLEWLVDAYLYPLDVGARPAHMPLAFVPIAFEMGVLVAALVTFLGILVHARLPQLWHPLFELDAFVSASRDRFWIGLSVADRPEEVEAATAILRGTGAHQVVWLAEADT